MAEYYIRLRNSGAIINCINTSKRMEDIDLSMYTYDVYLDPNPPLDVLKNYQYWDERP